MALSIPLVCIFLSHVLLSYIIGIPHATPLLVPTFFASRWSNGCVDTSASMASLCGVYQYYRACLYVWFDMIVYDVWYLPVLYHPMI